MGFISFIKDAGKKIFGDDEQEKAQEAAAKNEQAVTSLEENIKALGLEVQDLAISIQEDTATVEGTAADQATKEKVILVVGNSNGIAQVEDKLNVEKQEPEATYYTVKSGDYLSKIAKEVYGDAQKYNMIFEANKPMLENPDLIYPGQVLRIPPVVN